VKTTAVNKIKTGPVRLPEKRLIENIFALTLTLISTSTLRTKTYSGKTK